MSYEKHTWTNGETITAAKMNNIEEGIAEAAQSGGSDPYAAWDVVIEAVINMVDSSLSTLAVMKGNYADVRNRILNGELLSCIVKAKVVMSESPTILAGYHLLDLGIEDECIYVGVSKIADNTLEFSWNPDGSIEWYG